MAELALDAARVPDGYLRVMKCCGLATRRDEARMHRGCAYAFRALMENEHEIVNVKSEI